MPSFCPPIPDIEENVPRKERAYLPETWKIENWKAYVNGTYYGEVTSITPKGINIKQPITGRNISIRAITTIPIPSMVFGDKINK